MHEKIRLPVLIDSADVLPQEDHVVRTDGFFRERHAGIVGSKVAFFIIAAQTCRDEILPRIFAAAGFRMDVIDGKPCSRSAVLTGMAVAAQNIFSRENNFLERYSDKMRQADDARKIHHRMCRADHFSVSDIDNFRFFHEEQDNSFLHRADRQWFVVAIKE